MRRSLELYRTMFDTMAQASCLNEIVYENGRAVDYRILDMNPAFGKMFGLSASDAIGQPVSKLSGGSGNETAPFLEVCAQVAETREPLKYQADFALLGRSLEISLSSPTKGCFQAVFTDITDLKDLERKSSYLASYPALNSNPVFEIGIDGSLRYANPAALDTLRRLGLDPDVRSFLPGGPEELAALFARCRIEPQKEEFQLEDSAFIRDIAASGDDALRVYVVDITRRFQLEREVHVLNAELERRVELRTAELTAANRELEAYSYSVSHDLRTPLRSIDGFSHAFLEDYGDTIPEEGRRYLERIRGAAQRMGDLIEQMLLLSQITRSHLNPEPTDISALASSVAEELSKIYRGRKIAWEIEEGLEAICDKKLMRIILTNLMDNAVKFSSKREQATIALGEIRDPARGRAFFVRDDGAGFDPRFVSKLFTAFQRLHNQAEFPGTGIGLATVDRVVRKHGGEVWARGEPGKGATFYFTIRIPGSSDTDKEKKR